MSAAYGPDRDDDVRGAVADADNQHDGDADQAPPRDEAARVRAWRVERIAAIARGTLYGPDPDAELAALAEHVADAVGDDGFPVDLHAFERLVRAGATGNIAADLLVAL